jgi:phospholipase/carboxylesterase
VKREKLGWLDVAISGGTDRDGGGNGPVVVLLHGFGAPGEDLVPLWRVLEVPAETRFVFPAAPLELNIPFADARAWWMIDIARIEREIGQGNDWDLAHEVVPADVRDKVIGLIEALGPRLNVTPERMILGGFSQGAMVTMDVVLRTGLPFAGAALLSGALISEAEWVQLMGARRGMKVFQSHGQMDPLLPFAGAQRLKSMLVAAGMTVEWVPFAGGHEIPRAALAGLGAFISSAW